MDQREMINYWKTIVDTMTDGLIVVDTDGMIVAVNPATEQLTGFTREELIGSQCTILGCDHCSVRSSGSNFSCALFETRQIERCKCDIRRKNGETVPIIKNASVLIGKDGRVSGGVETITDRRALVTRDKKIKRLSSLLNIKDQSHGMIGKSKIMQNVFDLIADSALTDAPIIIYGESGTGKEVVATAIHNLGRRKKGPFIKVSCAALSESLLESELFGHVKGAYTGADRMRKGRFELANGGDIFLDEIGDIPLSMQVKILRVLQEKEIERVGDSTPIKIDCRIISATHRDLSAMIARDAFREDLFYRLNVIPIHLPPLRERREDLHLLVDHFLEVSRLKTNKDIEGISSEAMDALVSYSWPGNIRELINTIEYAFVVCREEFIALRHLPDTIKNIKQQRSHAPAGSGEQDRLLDALRRAGGKKNEAARLLGISRQALWKKMKKSCIRTDYE
jgi:two-component system response regulator HydG